MLWIAHALEWISMAGIAHWIGCGGNVSRWIGEHKDQDHGWIRTDRQDRTHRETRSTRKRTRTSSGNVPTSFPSAPSFTSLSETYSLSSFLLPALFALPVQWGIALTFPRNLNSIIISKPLTADYSLLYQPFVHIAKRVLSSEPYSYRRRRPLAAVCPAPIGCLPVPPSWPDPTCRLPPSIRQTLEGKQTDPPTVSTFLSRVLAFW